MSSAALVWNQQCLLTPIRYVINPRFDLVSPLQTGLFFLAPGIGYIVVSMIGGRWADAIVRKWIKRRGERIPEDRLRSTLTSQLVILPASILVYGWAIEKEVGGIPLPVACMLLQGAQMMCFPSLNTYFLDVIPGRGAEVVCKSYPL
jgi:MFS family permease